MKFRELLRTEIWSKRTTRKILVVIGTVVGVSVAALAGMNAVSNRWLTPGERSAAKAALVQIDSLQDFGSLSDQEFDARDGQAEAKVKAAEGPALTQRDKWVAFELDDYLSLTEMDREEVRVALLFWQHHLSPDDSRNVLGKKLDLTGTELRSGTRLVLHKELD